MDKSNDIYYVAGCMIDEGGPTKVFRLIRPSHTNLPYISTNRDSHALRLTGHTAALYCYQPGEDVLRKVSDIHYELNSKSQPAIVMISDEMNNELTQALDKKETWLD